MSNALRFALPLAAALLLGGCLEVDQHPAWDGGAYDGKTDSLPHERHYAGDHLAWNAAIVDRNHLQNEYRRFTP